MARRRRRTSNPERTSQGWPAGSIWQGGLLQAGRCHSQHYRANQVAKAATEQEYMYCTAAELAGLWGANGGPVHAGQQQHAGVCSLSVLFLLIFMPLTHAFTHTHTHPQFLSTSFPAIEPAHLAHALGPPNIPGITNAMMMISKGGFRVTWHVEDMDLPSIIGVLQSGLFDDGVCVKEVSIVPASYVRQMTALLGSETGHTVNVHSLGKTERPHVPVETVQQHGIPVFTVPLRPGHVSLNIV